MSNLRSSLIELLGEKGDTTVLNYVLDVLEDDEFEWGNGGDGAFEAIGEFLVKNAIPKRSPRYLFLD